MARQPAPTERMYALKAFKYGRNRLKPGDPFEAQRNHVRVLELLKRASRDHVHTPVVKPKPPVTAQVIESIPVVETPQPIPGYVNPFDSKESYQTDPAEGAQEPAEESKPDSVEDTSVSAVTTRRSRSRRSQGD